MPPHSILTLPNPRHHQEHARLAHHQFLLLMFSATIHFSKPKGPQGTIMYIHPLDIQRAFGAHYSHIL